MKYVSRLCLFAVVLICSCNIETGPFKRLYGKDQTINTPGNQRNPFDHIGDDYIRLIQKREALGEVVIKRSSEELNTALSILRKPDGPSYTIGKLWGLINQSPLSSSANETLKDFIATILYHDHEGYVAVYTYTAEYEDKVYASEIFTRKDKRILLSYTAIIRYASFNNDPFKFPRPSNKVNEFKGENWHLTIRELIAWLSVVLDDDFPSNLD